jgi:glutamine cyclotransferase
MDAEGRSQVQKHRTRERPSRARSGSEGSSPEPAPRERKAGFLGKRRGAVILGFAALALAAFFFVQSRMRSNRPPVFGCEVIASYPHDAEAFTQGLIYEGGFLYEGTGHNGASSLRHVELETGRVVRQVNLEPRHFGEGIAVVGDEIYQLTWRSRVGFVYDKRTFQKLREFKYTGEGWGLTYDGKHLVMSDGTETLRFLDPKTFREVRRLRVTDAGRRMGNVNELEFAEGFLYANLWHSDYIVKISPQSGAVVAWIDLRGLLPAAQRPREESVLNGIAYDAEGGRFFVTGKNWPTLFEVRFVEPGRDASHEQNRGSRGAR